MVKKQQSKKQSESNQSTEFIHIPDSIFADTLLNWSPDSDEGSLDSFEHAGSVVSFFDAETTASTADDSSLSLTWEKQLLLDIHAAGGLETFDLDAHCQLKPDFYGKTIRNGGTKAENQRRKKIKDKLYYWTNHQIGKKGYIKAFRKHHLQSPSQQPSPYPSQKPSSARKSSKPSARKGPPQSPAAPDRARPDPFTIAPTSPAFGTMRLNAATKALAESAVVIHVNTTHPECAANRPFLIFKARGYVEMNPATKKPHTGFEGDGYLIKLLDREPNFISSGKPISDFYEATFLGEK